MSNRNELRARRDVLMLLLDVAAGGYETCDGRPIPALVGTDAIRILSREWGIKIKRAHTDDNGSVRKEGHHA